MSRLVKCYGTCEEKYPKSEMIKYKGANHCNSCYEKKVKETNDREQLYNMLKQIFGINFPTGLMLRQIKTYKDERNYSYRNIAFTIDYMVKHKNIKLDVRYGIALVPHYYDEMIRYYKELNEKRSNTVVEEQQVKKIVMTAPSDINTYREKKMINMEDVLNDN